MAREASAAPKERVNITYRPATGNQKEEVELPLHLLVIGDFSGKADERPLEEREPIGIDKDNFDRVLAEHGVELALDVPNVLEGKDLREGQGDKQLSVALKIEKMADFGPDAIVRQVPAAKQLLALREALVALRGPMGNNVTFRRTLEATVKNPSTREKLLSELNVEHGEG